MDVTIITGGSDGIGAEMARQLAVRHGKDIALVLAGRSDGKLQAVAAQCRQHGAEVLDVAMDVGVEAECRSLVRQAVDRFGRIDTLVNNAGMSAQALFEDVRAEDLHWYEDLMRVNLWGAVWCTHAALPHLKASRGRIVAVSSLAGLVGVPGRTAYSATKFAMGGFFEALRTELHAARVSVTIAYPGVVTTRIRERGYGPDGRPLGRSGLKEEGAMSVEECARLIVDAARGRKRELVMTAKGKLGRFMKLLLPRMIDKVAMAQLKDDARPH
jgi:short-subunit dehydrogenase